MFDLCLKVSFLFIIFLFLKSINLSFNEIRRDGALVVSKSMKNKDLLECLNLDGMLFIVFYENLFESVLLLFFLCTLFTLFGWP